MTFLQFANSDWFINLILLGMLIGAILLPAPLRPKPNKRRKRK